MIIRGKMLMTIAFPQFRSSSSKLAAGIRLGGRRRRQSLNGRRRRLVKGSRNRRLISETLESRQMLAGDFDVRFVLTARDIETDQLLPNIDGVVAMTADNDQTLRYQVPINEVFKLEVAAQDLRERGSQFGIFRVVTDILVESKGVLEPAIGEVQELIFSHDILSEDNSSGMLEFYLDSNPEEKVTMSLAEFLGDGDAHVAEVIREVVVGLNDDVSSGSQVRTRAMRIAEYGPEEVPVYFTDVVYTDPSFVGVDMPMLRVNLAIDSDGTEGLVLKEVVENEFDVYVDRDGDGSKDDINPDRMYQFFELRNRNVGVGDPPTFNLTRVYGNTRVVGGFDQSDVERDIFDEVGGLGPVSGGGIFDAIDGFSGEIAYDAFAIPVRAVSLANEVSVRLDPPDVGDGVLLYGTETNKEEVASDRILLGGNSRFLIDVGPELSNVEAADIRRELDEDGEQVTIELSSSVEADPGDLLYSLMSTAVLGSVVLDGHILRYVPNENAFGTEELVYRVTHESGAFDEGQITFDIDPKPDAPVAEDDSVRMDEDGELRISVASLLANDTDADADDLLELASHTQPEHGTVTRSEGMLVYRPSDDFFGEDSFSYTISDSTGLRSTATVGIVIDPINDPPWVQGESARTEPNSPIVFAIEELLSNDVAGPLEVEQDLSIVAVSATSVAGSTVVIDGDKIVYTPATDMMGEDSFSYTVSDGIAEEEATITIQVGFDVEAVLLELPSGISSDLAVRRVGDRIEVVDQNNEQALLLNRPLNTILSLVIRGAIDKPNRIEIDHHTGGLITFVEAAASLSVVGGDTGDDEVIIRSSEFVNATVSERDVDNPTINTGMIARLQSDSVVSEQVVSGFEKITVVGMEAISVSPTSIFDVDDSSLYLGASEPVTMSRTIRINGGTLSSASPLMLGNDVSLFGNGVVDGRVVSAIGSVITSTGNLRLGDVDYENGIDIGGVLDASRHEVTLLDADGAMIRGRLLLGADSLESVSSVAGWVQSLSGIEVHSDGQIRGHGTIVTPNHVETPLLNNGLIDGNSLDEPLILEGWVTGAGEVSDVRFAGTWNSSDEVTSRLDGPVNFLDTSVTHVDIGGDGAGTTYDRLRFNPIARLDGVLEVELVNDFSPKVGNRFDLIEGTSELAGEFDAVVLPSLPDGLTWLVDQSASGVSLHIELDENAIGEIVHVEFSETNEIIILADSGQEIPVEGDTFAMNVDPKNQRFESPDSWIVGETEKVGGERQQVATNGSATLRFLGAGWTNFIDRFDINRVGGVTAVDALVIINELNGPKYSSAETSTLVDVNAVEAFPNVFFDVNGDGRVSAVDALQVINRLIALDVGAEPIIEGEPAGGEIVAVDVFSHRDSTDDESLGGGFAPMGLGNLDPDAVSSATDSVLTQWSASSMPFPSQRSGDSRGNEADVLLTDALELFTQAESRKS